MNHISDIISLLNKEESRNFKLFISRINFENSDKKLEKLYDHIKDGKHDENDTTLVKKLFGTPNMNAHYRLKNRLKDDLERSLLLHHNNLDEKVSVLNDLILSKICFYKSAYEQAYAYLRQAEKKAKAKNYYDVLNSIYDEMLVLCRFYNAINPNEINKLQADNAHKYLLLQKTNALIATLNYQLQQTNYSGKDKELTKEINSVLHTLNITEKQLHTPEIKFQIHDCVKNALLQKKDFKSLEPYLIKTYNEFNQQKIFTKENHDKKIIMLIWIINSIFKNKKTNESAKFLKMLNTEIEQFNKINFEKYYGSYVFSQVYFYTYTNQLPKAIELLQTFDKYCSDKKITQHSFNVNLNLCTLFYYQNEYDKAAKTLGKLFMKDAYKKLSVEWKLSLSILELIIQSSIGEWQYVENKLSELKRLFRKQLKDAAFEKEKSFVQIFVKLSKEPFNKKSENSNAQLQEFVKTYKTIEPGSNEAVNYTLFAKALLSKKSYYNLLLEEMN